MCMHAKSFQLCPTLCDPVNYNPPGSSVHGFFRQKYWSGLSCPSPGDLPNPGIDPTSLMSPALASRFFTTSTIWEVNIPIKFDKTNLYPENFIPKDTFYLWILTLKWGGNWPVESSASKVLGLLGLFCFLHQDSVGWCLYLLLSALAELWGLGLLPERPYHPSLNERKQC